jgi:hypothetical protein
MYDNRKELEATSDNKQYVFKNELLTRALTPIRSIGCLNSASNGEEANSNMRLNELKKPLDLNMLKEMMASPENGEFFEFFLNN